MSMAEVLGSKKVREMFVLDDDHTFINHGSYGAAPKVIVEEQIRLRNEMERNPDHWFQETLENSWLKNLKSIAEFVKSSPENLVFVPNATTGINAVLKSLPLQAGDGILTYTFTYKAIYNTCQAAALHSGGKVHIVQIELQNLTADQVIKSYRDYLEEHSDVKVVVLDLIGSCTSVYYPYKQLIEVCKQAGCITLVDGAHAPGQVPLDLENMGADFFIGNLHKWMYTSRGCAILWISPKYHDVIRPAVTSHCFKTGIIQKDFFTQGTLDATPYCTVEAALKVYQQFGGLEQINKYTKQLLDSAEDMLKSAWGVPGCPYAEELRAPYMRLIALPKDLPEKLLDPTTKGWPFSDLKDLKMSFKKRFCLTAVPLYIQQQPYVRLSAQVYNTPQDYEVLRDAVLTLRSENA